VLPRVKYTATRQLQLNIFFKAVTDVRLQVDQVIRHDVPRTGKVDSDEYRIVEGIQFIVIRVMVTGQEARSMESNTNPDSNAVLSPEGIAAQLERILSSDVFSDAPRLRQFLGYVVNESLSGRTEHIKGFTIAHDVFHRENPTDAQDSTIVRVEAGRLRRRLQDYYLKEGRQDPIRIEIPKGGYVPLFEKMSPATAAVAADRPPFEPPRPRRPRPARKAILAFVVIMLTLFALLRIYFLVGNENLPGGNSTLPAKPAIAVLPFADTTTDTSGSTFATGLTEDIITDLSSLNSIDVIALSSVLPYLDKTLPSQQIAAELNVIHILRGSIRGSVDQLRVTTELFDAGTGRQIWAIC
jgi:TolB-like protein